MQRHSLSVQDYELLSDAKRTQEEYFVPGKHRTSAGLLTTSGEVYTAINFVTSANNAAIHCEPLVVSQAVQNKDTNYESIVAVTYPNSNPENNIEILSPCGTCRELLNEFCGDINVILQNEDGDEFKSNIKDLLPEKANDPDYKL